MIDLLWCDGTWTKPTSRSVVSEALRRELDPTKVRFIYVDYPGTFGPATGWDDVSPAESVRVGIKNIETAVAGSPYRAIVGGYSQGAMVAVRFARERLTSRPDLIVDAVATLGDPYMPKHSGGRYGIAGVRTTPRDRLTLCVPGDPIADLPAGSPLRSIADVTEYMSIRTPEDSRRWALQTLEKVPSRLQAWWAPWSWGDLLSAGQYMTNYLGTHHTMQYVESGLTARLARQIERYAE